MDIAKDRYRSHAISGVNPEFTLCGNACDGDGDYRGPIFEDPMAWESVKGDSITCSICCSEIKRIQGFDFKLRPKR